MLLINRDISKVKEIVQKQIDYLYKSSSNKHFQKNHYSFYMSDEYFSVSLLLKEQLSGSCYSDEIYEPLYYNEKVSLVKQSLRILLSAIFPRMKSKQLKVFVNQIFDRMEHHSYTNYGYYGNYESFKKYKITISDVYNIIDEFSLKS